MWQQSTSQLFNSIIVWLFVKGQKIETENSSVLIFLSGFFVGLSFFCRLTNIIIVIVTTLYVLIKHRKIFFYFITGLSIPVILLFIYNLSVFNNIFGGYKDHHIFDISIKNFFINISGLLISPNRGIFIYSPVFLFSLIGMIFVFSQYISKKNVNEIYVMFSLVVIFYLILLAGYKMWWGGWGFGYRFLCDIIPFLIVLIVPVIIEFANNKQKILEFIFIIFSIYSIGIQIIGVYFDDSTWSKYPDVDNNTYRLWNWNDWQITYILNNSFNPNVVYYNVLHNVLNKYTGYGWSDPEKFGVWGIGKESTIFLQNLIRTKKVNLHIIATSHKINQKMKIYLDNKLIKEFVFNKPPWIWENILIKNVNLEKKSKMKFTYNYSCRASYRDPRRISVAFKQISFEN